MTVSLLAEKSLGRAFSFEESIAEELLAIEQHAKVICDLHWQSLEEERDGRTFRFITRIRTDRGLLQCHWLYAGTKAQKGKPLMAKHVPKGTARFNPNYKMSVFNKAEPWERDIIFETEKNYSLLRERHMKLIKIRDEFRRYKNITKESYERVGIPWEF